MRSGPAAGRAVSRDAQPDGGDDLLGTLLRLARRRRDDLREPFEAVDVREDPEDDGEVWARVALSEIRKSEIRKSRAPRTVTGIASTPTMVTGAVT